MVIYTSKVRSFDTDNIYRDILLKAHVYLSHHLYLVVKNSMSLFVFSSILLGPTSSSTSCAISGRLLMLPPRLRLDDVEEELKPESGMGEA